MNRDLERSDRINSFLDWDNEEEIIEDVIKICTEIISKNPKLASKLSTGLTSIISSTVESLNKDINEHWLGIESAVNYP